MTLLSQNKGIKMSKKSTAAKSEVVPSDRLSRRAQKAIIKLPRSIKAIMGTIVDANERSAFKLLMLDAIYSAAQSAKRVSTRKNKDEVVAE